MYQIYIEYYFLLNFVFTFCIWELAIPLALPCSVTRGKNKVIASGLGALFSCICFMIPVVLWYRILLGFLIGSLTGMRILLGKHAGKKQYIKLFITAVEMGALLGGGIAWIQRFLLRRTYSMAGIIIISAGITVVLRLIFQKYRLSKKNIFYKAELVLNGKKYCMQALLDTGNSLTEPISKKAVCLIDREYLETQWKKEGERNWPEMRKFRAIPYHAVGTETGILYGYEMDLLFIDTEDKKITIYNPMIGVSDWKIGSPDTYQMILHPKLLIEGE